MDQNALERDFMVARSGTDRRKAGRGAPPYLTEDGLVLVDRRESGERRTQRAANEGSGRDLVLERVKRLAMLYGYQTVTIG